jgi:hypothetical protein
MGIKVFSLISLIIAAFSSCSNNTTAGNKEKTANEISKTTVSENYLVMKINGREWKADGEIFGAFHPKGYNKAMIISGTKGPKDKNEQAFNINLYNTNGPAVFQMENGNTDNNVVQLGGLSETNFLYGSMMGFKMKVHVTKASQNPTILEATFEGVLTGNAGDKLTITEGKFYYQE